MNRTNDIKWNNPVVALQPISTLNTPDITDPIQVLPNEELCCAKDVKYCFNANINKQFYKTIIGPLDDIGIRTVILSDNGAVYNIRFYDTDDQQNLLGARKQTREPTNPLGARKQTQEPTNPLVTRKRLRTYPLSQKMVGLILKIYQMIYRDPARNMPQQKQIYLSIYMNTGVASV